MAFRERDFLLALKVSPVLNSIPIALCVPFPSADHNEPLPFFPNNGSVLIASQLADDMNVPHSVIGSTVSGLGTSLPELTIALMAARKSEGVAIGTLIGSNITDPLLSIGIAAIISPLVITSSGEPMLLNFIIPTTIIGSTLAIFMMWTQYEFKRWEGLVLILFYAVFVAMLAAAHFEYISF